MMDHAVTVYVHLSVIFPFQFLVDSGDRPVSLHDVVDLVIRPLKNWLEILVDIITFANHIE